jgi:hypothetical protein
VVSAIAALLRISEGPMRDEIAAIERRIAELAGLLAEVDRDVGTEP